MTEKRPAQINLQSETCAVRFSSMAVVNWLMFLIALYGCIVVEGALPPLPRSPCIQSKCDRLASPPSLQLNCKCEDDCTLYNDCCLDYTPNNSSTHQPNVQFDELLECLEVNYTRHILGSGGNSVWMVSRCPQPSELNEKCTNQSLFLPVTDSHSNLTFRNIYCAMCNNISVEQVELWQPQFHCDDQVMIANLSVNFSTFEEIKQHCFMHEIVLEGNNTRSCIPHIRTCPSNSTAVHFDLVRNCTQGPFDLTAASGNNTRIFKNSACAECNGIPSTMCLFQEVDSFSSKSGVFLKFLIIQ